MRRAPLIGLLLLAAGCSQPPDPARPVLAPPPPPPPPQPQLVRPAPLQTADLVFVDKSDRTLTLYAQGQPYRTYHNLQFGDAPAGHKRFQGDERTPEGRYTIDYRNPQSAYHLSLRISYPNAEDRSYATARGRSPGGEIFIHGQPNGLRSGRVAGDWTDGCIALSNAEIEELWRLVPDGTPIEIAP